MPNLLLAPYNDSMRLGQGFNSYLQVPRLYDAVLYNADDVELLRGVTGREDLSQSVSYSSRFVERISEVVRGMNISAGSSIKAGSVEVSGNSLSVDEAKFSASDLNAVVSVKVANQTTQISAERCVFNPLPTPSTTQSMTAQQFFQTYGDCYISGFVEGGELHGIVSIKVMDVSQKNNVEHAVKGFMNTNRRAKNFSLRDDSDFQRAESALEQTETTITVNWSGGGQVKHEAEEWTLESLFRTAAAFPARVAMSPMKTWAILTKYDNNRSFLEWNQTAGIPVPHFEPVESYTSDLLDMYMQYKNNVARLNQMLDAPGSYSESKVINPVKLDITSLVKERQDMRVAMSSIVKQIDQLCQHPDQVDNIQQKSTIQAPEIWAARLPVPKETSPPQIVNMQEAMDQLKMFAIGTPGQSKALSKAQDGLPKPPDSSGLLKRLFVDGANLEKMAKQAVFTSWTLEKFVPKLRFDVALHHPENEYLDLKLMTNDGQIPIEKLYQWPTAIKAKYSTTYKNMTFLSLTFGENIETSAFGDGLFDLPKKEETWSTVTLDYSERITSVSVGTRGGSGIGQMVFTTSKRTLKIGPDPDYSDMDKVRSFHCPSGFAGLKTFYTYRGSGGWLVDIGFVWSRED